MAARMYLWTMDGVADRHAERMAIVGAGWHGCTLPWDTRGSMPRRQR